MKLTREVVIPPTPMSWPARVALLSIILSVSAIAIEAAAKIARLDAEAQMISNIVREHRR